MIVKPSISELLKIVDNRFDLVIIASKRARQLSNGSMPLTDKKEESMVSVAAHEISEGKVVVC